MSSPTGSEARIDSEIVVDCYGEAERANGWWNYLDDRLSFPFRAKCVQRSKSSPLLVGEEVEAIKLDDDEQTMRVVVRWQNREFSVPLAQLSGIGVDAETKQAIGDWRYWVARGYNF